MISKSSSENLVSAMRSSSHNFHRSNSRWDKSPKCLATSWKVLTSDKIVDEQNPYINKTKKNINNGWHTVVNQTTLIHIVDSTSIWQSPVEGHSSSQFTGFEVGLDCQQVGRCFIDFHQLPCRKHTLGFLGYVWGQKRHRKRNTLTFSTLQEKTEHHFRLLCHSLMGITWCILHSFKT